jgi:hypothetical protein
MEVLRVVVMHLPQEIYDMLRRRWRLICLAIILLFWLSYPPLEELAYTGYPPPPPDGDGEHVGRGLVSILPAQIPVAIHCQSIAVVIILPSDPVLPYLRCEWEGRQHTPEYREWLRRRRDTQHLMWLLSFVSPMRLLASLLPLQDSSVSQSVRRRRCRGA